MGELGVKEERTKISKRQAALGESRLWRYNIKKFTLSEIHV